MVRMGWGEGQGNDVIRSAMRRSQTPLLCRGSGPEWDSAPGDGEVGARETSVTVQTCPDISALAGCSRLDAESGKSCPTHHSPWQASWIPAFAGMTMKERRVRVRTCRGQSSGLHQSRPNCDRSNQPGWAPSPTPDLDSRPRGQGLLACNTLAVNHRVGLNKPRARLYPGTMGPHPSGTGDLT